MKKRVLVFGSYVTDLSGRVSAFPKEGETLKGNCFYMGPGGKGSNQAVAAKRAGADVRFITKIGWDALGREAENFYKQEGLWGDNIIIDPKEHTGAALIIVNENTSQNMISVIGGACENFNQEDISYALKCVEDCDILLLQLETNMQPIEALLMHAKHKGVMAVLNPAPAQSLPKELLQCVDIIIPNETEACFYTGIHVKDEKSADIAARKLIDMGVSRVVIKMGDKGCYAMDGKSGRYFDVVHCGKTVDTTGAGDAFSGGFTAALSCGMDFFDAVSFGSIVAGIAVTRYGTAPAMPFLNEILKHQEITDRLRNK